MSCIVFRLFNGEGGVIHIGKFSSAPLNTLWLYLVLGMLFGVIGVIFSKLLFYVQTQFQHFYQDKTSRFVLTGGIIGGLCGLLALIIPEITGVDLALFQHSVPDNILLLHCYFSLFYELSHLLSVLPQVLLAVYSPPLWH